MVTYKIINYDDFSGEVDLLISDGTNELLCYSSSFSDNAKTLKIRTFLCDNITRIDSVICRCQKQSGYYSYFLQGEVIDTINKIVSIGDILIELDSDFPKDIINGEYVSFTVMRLDCTFI